MNTRRAGALFVASWTAAGCNVLVGLDDVNIVQDGAAGAAATAPSGGGGAASQGGGGTPAQGGSPGGAGGSGASPAGAGGDTSSSASSGGAGGEPPSGGAGGEPPSGGAGGAPSSSSSSSTGAGGGTSSSSGSGGGMPGTPCGDGMITDAEQCDDGNPDGGDGCSAECQVEPYHQCTVPAPSVCTKQEIRCADGIDGDGDGVTDMDDMDCWLPGYAPDVPCPGLRVLRSVNVPVSIPDNGAGKVYSPIVVPDELFLGHTAVVLDISHPRVSDVDATLLPPFGSPRVLTSDNGGNGSNYTATLFDVDCPVPVTSGIAPFKNCYKPESPLPSNGQQAKGVWTLEVDDYGSGQSGTLDAWTLILCEQ